MVLIRVLIQLIGEQSDEPSSSEVARCDPLVAEVVCEVSVHDAEETVKLKEEQF